MSIVQGFLLGLLQGVTEFLPVSSSGHLVLARAVMGISEVPVLFDVILHISTLIVVIWVFRARVGSILAALARLVAGRRREEDGPALQLTLKLLAASAFTAVIGLGVSALDVREEPGLVSALLLVTAIILIASVRGRGGRDLDSIGWGRSLVMGAAQGFGVFPGISRSGITIGSGLLGGLDRQAAGEFSFLLSLPAVGGAFLLSLGDVAELGASVPVPSLAAGFLAALLAGYASLRLLLWLISGGRLWIFAVYLIPVGIWGIARFGL